MFCLNQWVKTVIIPQYIYRILFSAPFASAVFFLLFYVPGSYRPEEAGKKPETEISMEGKLGYYLAMFCLFEGLMSVSSKVVKLAFFAFIRFERLISVSSHIVKLALCLHSLWGTNVCE